MPCIFFHEDDFCQIEILPVENFAFCLQQVERITEFADAHRVGDGYSDVYMLNDVPFSLHSKKMSATILQSALDNVLPEFEEVFYADSEPNRRKCNHTRAFGHDQNAVLFYDHEDDIIKHIWLALDVKKRVDIAVSNVIFDVLSKTGEFLVADWGWEFILTINNSAAIDSYLEERFKVFGSGDLS